MTKYVAFLILSFVVGTAAAHDAPATKEAVSVEERLERVRAIHGGAGPWAVAGCRIGEAALRNLGAAELLAAGRPPLPGEGPIFLCRRRSSGRHGASVGKLNLRVEEAPLEELRTAVEDRKSGRRLTFRLKPDFARSIAGLPYGRLGEEGRRVAELPEEAIFEVTEGDEAAKR